MIKKNNSAIQKWIKTMGFELINSHESENPNIKTNYYTLGNFGLFEKIIIKNDKPSDQRFITWNPWGIDFEVHSLAELQDAYQNFISFPLK